jgi:WD40 repeat protein
VAWSPDGLRLALTLPSGPGGERMFRTFCPKRDTDNLLILESGSGRVLVRIKTGDIAGPVCFGPHEEVFTAPLHFYFRGSKGEQVKVWNAQTGALERTIGFPGRDVHNVLALSPDGRVLVGYVGKEKFGYSWRAMEDVFETLDQRFAVWDAATGGLVAISQDVSPLSGTLRSYASKLRLHLTADGGSLLADWDATPSHLLLFDLPETRAHHSK